MAPSYGLTCHLFGDCDHRASMVLDPIGFFECFDSLSLCLGLVLHRTVELCRLSYRIGGGASLAGVGRIPSRLCPTLC